MNIAYKYGLKAPLDWDDDCEAEIERMTALWNRLLEIEEAHSAAVLSIGSDDPAVQQAQAEAEARQAELQAAREERARRRKAAKSKAKTPELDAEIERLKQAAAEAWQALKALKRTARTNSREKLRELETARLAAVKTARQESGCYWGNYNAVIGSYDSARKRRLAAGGALRPQNAKRSRVRIVNQIQGGCTLDDLLSGRVGQASLSPRDLGRVKSGRPRPEYLLTLTVYTHSRGVRRTVSWPLILHRPIPEGARIQMISVTRTRRYGRPPEWEAVFSLRLPTEAVETAPRGGACGVDVGWRQMTDGHRVATVVDDTGTRQFVALPQRIADGIRYADDLRSEIDSRTNTRLAWLRTLPWSTAPKDLADLAREIAGKKAPHAGDLARLVAAWPEDWQPEARAQAARDVRANRRDRREQTGLRLRMVRARRDHYRNEALRLARRYALIGIEDISLADLALAEDNPTPAAARYNRFIAAPGEFLECLRWAARKTGARIHAHSGKSTWICHDCGTELMPRDPARLVVSCPACHAVWDQDVNAARNLLAAALASAEEAKDTPGALAPEPSMAYEGRWQKAKRLAAERAGHLAKETIV